MCQRVKEGGKYRLWIIWGISATNKSLAVGKTFYHKLSQPLYRAAHPAKETSFLIRSIGDDRPSDIIHESATYNSVCYRPYSKLGITTGPYLTLPPYPPSACCTKKSAARLSLPVDRWSGAPVKAVVPLYAEGLGLWLRRRPVVSTEPAR